MQLLTSGKIAPQVQVTPSELISTAEKIHEFLTADHDKHPPVNPDEESGTPLESSPAPDSTRKPSKVTAAQPDGPPEF